VGSATDIIRALDLKPHPEGGHYRETFRDSRLVDGRAASTAILFLLAHDERSHWQCGRDLALSRSRRRAAETVHCRRRGRANHPPRRRYFRR
jgi:predicted cupin superfamily sugar epimerase